MNKVNRFHEEGADPALVEKFNKANKEFLNSGHSFTGIKAEAYLYLKGDEWGDSWRVRIVDLESGDIITDSLDPMIVDGHVCYVIARVAMDHFNKGIVEGIERAADAQAKAAIKAVYENSGWSPRDPAHKEIVNGRKGIRGLITIQEENQ